MESILLIFHKHTVIVTGQLFEHAEVHVTDRHGLLAKDIQAGRKAIGCNRIVRGWWSGNMNKVGLELRKKLLVACIPFRYSKPLRGSLGSSRGKVAYRYDLNIIECGQYREMLARNGAAAYENPCQLTHPMPLPPLRDNDAEVAITMLEISRRYSVYSNLNLGVSRQGWSGVYEGQVIGGSIDQYVSCLPDDRQRGERGQTLK
jgi:hypothetical protein